MPLSAVMYMGSLAVLLTSSREDLALPYNFTEIEYGASRGGINVSELLRLIISEEVLEQVVNTSVCDY